MKKAEFIQFDKCVANIDEILTLESDEYGDAILTFKNGKKVKLIGTYLEYVHKLRKFNFVA